MLAHLAARGVPTPAPHRTRAGAPFAEHKGKLVTLFPWAAGRHLGAREVLERHVAAVGAALARLHVAGADFPAAERRPGIYTLSHVQARFATFEQSGDPQLAQAVRLLGAELERLPRERVPDLPEGLLHQDLFRDNVLFGRAGATGSGGDEDAIVALLDFEQAAWGRLAYDLAVCLCAWCFQDQAFDPALVRAMVEAYERERPLLAAERAGLAVEARVAAVRFTVTRVTDVYMRPLGAPGGKDFRSYLARVRALGEAGLPVG